MNPRPAQFVTSPSVVAQITQPRGLYMQEIKVLWKRLFGGDIPNHNRPFLKYRLAYQLQLIEFSKVDRNLLESNQRRIETLIRNGRLNQRNQDHPLAVGTILTRVYQEMEHSVVVELDRQFVYQGRHYGSLSVIAREIPGTRWSGRYSSD